jgi:hypothetical protein
MILFASIQVPAGKARAAVDAMEPDTGTTLETQEDLKPLEDRFASARTEMRQDFDWLRSELRKDMQALLRSITLRFAAMLAVSVGVTVSVLLTAMRLWL